METLSWLHISDLHFQSEKTNTYTSDVVLDTLLEDIHRLLNEKNIELDFIFITGDIASKGDMNDYERAKVFFEKLLEKTGF